ncbi:MAG: ABC transporter ATP-binding protein [Coriobacteriia bacterium]
MVSRDDNDVALPNVISLQGVSKRFEADSQPSVMAVDGVSLDIAAGEFVVISGRSGSGKTTLLHMMAGLAAPSSGRVWLQGRDLWGLTDAGRSQLRNDIIGFVFQFPSLMPMLTVLENIMLPRAFGASVSVSGLEARARELLTLVGISEKEHAYPRQLSAGQQQRVVLARSLINAPRVIFADEPTSNLDECTEGEMLGLFQNVHESREVTIVMVTHAAALLPHGTRAIEMAAGRITADSDVGHRTASDQVCLT